MLTLLLSLLISQTCPCPTTTPIATPSPVPVSTAYVASDPNFPDRSCDGYVFDAFPPKDSDGWTIVGPGERVIYVSAKNAVTNDGTHFFVKTIDDGAKLLRSGHADQLLFKRGEIFDGNFGVDNKYMGSGGPDAQHLMLIGAYGSGLRPILNFSKGGLLNLLGSSSNFAVQSLDLEAPMNRTTDYAAIRMVARNKNVLFEDLRIVGFNLAFNLDLAETAQNILIRRSQLLDSYTASQNGPYAFGIYAARVAGLRMDEIVMDHNGWKTRGGASSATIFQRNAYIQSDTKCITFSRSFSTNSSSEGIEMKSGGVMSDNFFAWNPEAANYGQALGGAVTAGIIPKGVSGSIERNVFLYAVNLTPSLPRTGGLQLANLTHVKVSDNLIAHQDGFNLYANQGLGIHELTLYNNIVYDSSSKFMVYGSAFGPVTLVADGKGQSFVVNAKGVVVVKDGSTGIAMAAGQKLSIADAGSLVMANVFQKGPTDYLNLAALAYPSVAFLNFQTKPSVFRDPMRDPQAFQNVGSDQGFVNHLRNNSYDPVWSAPAVNAWMRDGYLEN